MKFKPDSDAIMDDREFNYLKLFKIVFSEKWVILSVVLFCIVVAFGFAKSQTEIYRSEALLTPSENFQANTSMVSQLGVVAGLAGLSLGDSGGGRVSTAIATIQSRGFIKLFVEKHSIVVPLMAGEWDAGSRQTVVNAAVYDISTAAWIDAIPTDVSVYRRFSNVMSVSQNTLTGLVTISIDWYDPIAAKNWASWLIEDINSLFKQQDLEEASQAISYLQQKLQTTQLVEMQRAFYQLIESQTRIVMLADVRDDYVFRVIDPPFIPEELISPRVFLIILIGLLVGVITSMLLVVYRNSSFSN